MKRTTMERLYTLTSRIPEWFWEDISGGEVKINKEQFMELLIEHFMIARKLYDQERRKFK
jgi:hypothetical protein